jgi:hypothetical protein
MSDDTLSIRWSKKENDFLIEYPNGPDGHLCYGHFCYDRPRPRYRITEEQSFDPPFVEELKRRGYDITTLKFSVKRKPRA